MPTGPAERAADLRRVRAAERRVQAAAQRALQTLEDETRRHLATSEYSPVILTPDLWPSWRAALARLATTIQAEFVASFNQQVGTSMRGRSLRSSITAAVGYDAHANAVAYMQRVKNRLAEVPDPIFRRIRRELRAGMAAGESITDLADRVDKVLADAGARNWLGRAEVIARTESIAAFNMGRLQAGRKLAKDLDIPQRDVIKEWMATRTDDRTRPTHVAADGQQRRLTRRFVVGGHPARGPGDPRLPAHECIQCRCTVVIRLPGDPGYPADPDNPDVIATLSAAVEETEPMTEPAAVPTAEGEPDSNTDGVVIVALPAADDPIHDAGDVAKHMTVIWLGKTAEQPADRPDYAAIVARVAAGLSPITANVDKVGPLGDEGAQVAHLAPSPALTAMHDALADDPDLATQMGQVDQFPSWLPHVTLAYAGDAPDAAGHQITFDRLALWDGNDQTAEYRMGAPVTEDMPTEAEMDEEANDLVDGIPMPWYGVLAPEGVMSGDKRKFAAGSLGFRDLPLPIKYQDAEAPGHDGSVRVANIMGIARVDGQMRAWGTFDFNPTADEAIRQIAMQMLRGVSVDVDAAEFAFEDADGNPVEDGSFADDGSEPIMVVTSGRIAAATLCSIPAFQEAYIALGEPPEEWGLEYRVEEVDPADDPDEERDDDDLDYVVMAADDGIPGVMPRKLKAYWVRGEGAAKIGWGTAGDFERCRTNLAEHVPPQMLSGLCANLHKAATGEWPGRGKEHAAEALAAGAMAPAWTLTASAVVEAPAADFEDPHLDGPTPLTVTADGRVFGHLATWGTCHIGFSGQCVTPPTSYTGYAYFQTGAVLTDDGVVPVGHITIGTGHADATLRAAAAVAHYDNTGTVAADVAAGDDEYGIWLAGRMRPGADIEATMYALRAAALSGDWRRIGGNLELVAALAVNTPGFPIPRVRTSVVAGAQMALVAAGVVQHAANPADRADTLSTDVGPAEQPGPITARDIAREWRALEHRVQRARSAAIVMNAERVRRAAALINQEG